MSSAMEHFTFGDTGLNAAVSSSTPETVSGASIKCKRVILKAPSTNTGIIYFSRRSAMTASDSFPLEAGAESPWLDVSDVQDIYVLASVNGEDVAYMYDY